MVTLPDSTRVYLNANSQVRYGQDYGIEERWIALEGEAYFEVSRNEAMPLTVKTSEVEVQVLGTIFNVEAYADQATVVSLIEGKVAVKQEEQSLELKPNQEYRYNPESGESSVVEIDALASSLWRYGTVSFEDKTLGEVVERLGEIYQCKIEILTSHLRDKNIHASFRPEEQTIEEILNVLALTNKMKVEHSPDGLVLRDKK